MGQVLHGSATTTNVIRPDLSDAKGLTRRQLETTRNVDWDRVPPDLPDA